MTHPSDPYGELASMFLTEPDAPRPAAPRVRTVPTSEIVVVGHLPVRASLWLSPYADATSRRDGATALVRLDGDEPLVQVFGLPSDPMHPETCRTVRETILHLGALVRTWIVRPSPRRPVAELPGLRCDRLTILSSADEMALVNTYRLVKEMVDAAERTGRALSRLAVSVLGAPEGAARDMLERLRRTTDTHLGIELDEGEILPRIEAQTRSAGLRSFDAAQAPDLEDVLAWIELARTRHARAAAESAAADPIDRTITEPTFAEPAREPVIETFPAAIAAATGRTPPSAADAEAPPMAPPVAPSVAPPGAPPAPVAGALPLELEADAIEHRPRRDAEGGLIEIDVRHAAAPAAPAPAASAPSAPAVEPRRTAPIRVVESLDDDEEIAAAPVGPFPEPLERVVASRRAPFALAERELEARGPCAPREPDAHGAPVPLASHVAGLVPIAPRCPGRERVELALDARGTIHLLALEADLREAIAVESWARAHREILAMCVPDRTIDPAGRTAIHLFTDQPLKVADLLDGRFHLHVRAPVEVNGATGWYVAALNRVR